jgi:hypothetical protein
MDTQITQNTSKKYDDSFSKWIHHTYSDVELKQIAKDIYADKIFTNRHLAAHESGLVMSVFMPLMWLLNTSNPICAKDRLSKIDAVLVENAREKYFEQLGRPEEEVHKEYINDIGLIFEYNSKALPQGINGCPIFSSVRFLTIEQTKQMNEYYDKIVEHMNSMTL